MPSSLTARTAARRRDWVVEACLASVESPKNKTKTPSLSSTGASTLALSRLLSRRALHLPTAKHLPPPHTNLIELSHHSHTHKHTQKNTQRRVGWAQSACGRASPLRTDLRVAPSPPALSLSSLGQHNLLLANGSRCRRKGAAATTRRCCRHKALLPPLISAPLCPRPSTTSRARRV